MIIEFEDNSIIRKDGNNNTRVSGDTTGAYMEMKGPEIAKTIFLCFFNTTEVFFP